MSSYSSSPPITPPSSDSEDDASESHSTMKRRNSQHKQPSPHPFAASTKATREPPSYQKKYPITPISNNNGRITLLTYSLKSPPTTPPTTPDRVKSVPIAESEQKRWDTAIANAVDRAEPKLDLSFSTLTYIPPSIVDLKGLLVLPKRELFPAVQPPNRPFLKSITAPPSAGLFNHSSSKSALLPAADIPVAAIRPFARAETAKHSPKFTFSQSRQHSIKNGLELYLMSNRITSLPRELFELDRLVVLSLRGNKLTSLPPAIRLLKSLRELNIANNRISFLPAELQELHLETLYLHPNPYRELPVPPVNLGGRRLLGPLIRGPVVPSLKELTLRYLLAADDAQSTRIEALTSSEIDSLPVPGHLRSILRASTGHNRGRLSTVQTNDMAEMDMRSNICPTLHRRGPVGPLNGIHKNLRFLVEDRASVFHTPVEERMEWVGEVAQVTVGYTPKAFIPILWRGCSYGCLNFLETSDIPDSDNEMPAPLFTNKFGSTIDDNGDEFEFSDKE